MVATFLLTVFALLAFAANSLLCRMALGAELIDPVSFTTIRLVSGALALVILARSMREPAAATSRSHHAGSGLALFAYAIAFSLAYVSLDTGVGALVLFGAVQLTMISAACLAAERLSVMQWVGSIVAVGGLAYLVRPGLAAPDPLGVTLMAVAGLAWGIYSLRGRRSGPAPVAATSANFLWASPLALVAAVASRSRLQLEPSGVALALVSGVVTSGLGYVVWYRALKTLTTARASVVQLLVPVLAAFGGVLFLAEPISARLIVASALILGGVALAVWRRDR